MNKATYRNLVFFKKGTAISKSAFVSHAGAKNAEEIIKQFKRFGWIVEVRNYPDMLTITTDGEKMLANYERFKK